MNRITRVVAAGTITAAVTLAGMLGGASAASAATAACTSRTTHSHTVSSRGTVSDRTELRVACGKAYQVWEHGWSRSYTGASSTFHLYKDGRRCPGHWTETEVRRSVSKTGSVTNRVTDSSGTC